jgi:hypothetical protein
MLTFKLKKTALVSNLTNCDGEAEEKQKKIQKK